MRIENLTTLLNGELKNSPKISMINGFCLDPNLVKVGMAYFALNATIEDALLAIKSGAYAIITDLSLNSKDDEIAIIKVDSVVMAMIRLMRFLSAQILKYVSLREMSSNLTQSNRKILVLQDARKKTSLVVSLQIMPRLLWIFLTVQKALRQMWFFSMQEQPFILHQMESQ